MPNSHTLFKEKPEHTKYAPCSDDEKGWAVGQHFQIGTKHAGAKGWVEGLVATF